MLIVQVAHGIHPFQIDDFPAAAARSVKGALYFAPNTTKEMTADEWAHIQQKHAGSAASMRVIVAEAAPPAPPAPLPAAPASPISGPGVLVAEAPAPEDKPAARPRR